MLLSDHSGFPKPPPSWGHGDELLCPDTQIQGAVFILFYLFIQICFVFLFFLMILNFNMTDFYLFREYAWVCHISYAKTNKEKNLDLL